MRLGEERKEEGRREERRGGELKINVGEKRITRGKNSDEQ